MCVSVCVTGYKAANGVDFANIKFLSVNLSWGSKPQNTPTTKFLRGSRSLDSHGIGVYVSVVTSAACTVTAVATPSSSRALGFGSEDS